jgi:hypothetical protein
MGLEYMSQKTMLQGWTGNVQHPEWIKLNVAIDARIGRRPFDPAAIAVQVGTNSRSPRLWGIAHTSPQLVIRWRNLFC